MSTTPNRPTCASYVSATLSIAISVLLFVIAFFFLKSSVKANKRSKLGERAPPVPSWLPFREPHTSSLTIAEILTVTNTGIDNGIMLVRSIKNNSLLEMAQRVLQVPGRTVEIRMGANDIVWTDNPENIRAILSTKVSPEAEALAMHTDPCRATVLAKARHTIVSGRV